MDETHEFPMPSQAETASEVVPTPSHAPEMTISPLAPIDRLQEADRQVLNRQWQRFWEARRLPTEPNEEPVQIESGYLLHNLRYDAQAIQTIFESGILAGELGYENKGMIPEDSETNFCADFFQYAGEQPTLVGDYFVKAVTPEAVGMIRKKPMEAYASPTSHEQQIPDGKGNTFQGRDNDNISFIVDPSQPAIADLMQLSSDGATYQQNPDGNPLKPFINRFPHESNRHVAVLVGVPANGIRAMVVGGAIESNPEALSLIRTKMETAKLNIPVLNAVGKPLKI